MRKRILSLVLTFALVLSVAVARPPTAKASLAITASVAGAVLLAIAGASGIQIASQGYDSAGIYEAIQDWISDNLAERFTDVQDFLDELNDMNAPITPGGGPGKFIVSAAATALFTELLGNIVTSAGLADGSEPVTVAQSSGNSPYYSLDPAIFTSSNISSDGIYHFSTAPQGDTYAFFTIYLLTLKPGYTLDSIPFVPRADTYSFSDSVGTNWTYSLSGSSPNDFRINGDLVYSVMGLSYSGVLPVIVSQPDNMSGGEVSTYVTFLFKSSNYTDKVGILICARKPLDEPFSSYFCVTSPISASSIAVSVPDTLALPVEGEDLELTVPGSEAETVEDLAADVYDQVADNTLSPTIEVTVPETVTGTLTEIKEGILNLPQRIGEAIKSLFVPDADFFPEAIADLQEAFDDRFGLLTYPISILADFIGEVLQIADQEPILRWNSVRIYDRELIPAGQYNLNDILSSSAFHTVHDVYLVVVDAVMILAFVELCRKKYRSVVHN